MQHPRAVCLISSCHSHLQTLFKPTFLTMDSALAIQLLEPEGQSKPQRVHDTIVTGSSRSDAHCTTKNLGT